MTTAEPLHSVPATTTESTLRFDRRRGHRSPAQGLATIFCLGSDRFGEDHDLRMIDWSDGGMGAIASDPLEPGALVSIGFQTPGCLGRRGVVTRCLPCGEGYRIGIRFESRMAA
ncbi:MAG: PilZ domain-containing protein [Phycisphaerales bacterium]|nr:PilZ domain-containing protein [Phycisphaerales bacterium]